MKIARLFEEKAEPLASPKLLTCSEINVIRACNLNRRWHSRLPEIHWSNVVRSKHYICYGAFYNNVVYAVAIWSSPVAANRFKNGDTLLELRRMAISPEAPKYTATWMLSRMIKDIKKRFPKITRLISYQDTEVHKGTIYAAANWTKCSETKYIDWTTRKRKRSEAQSKANKVRWEYCIDCASKKGYVPKPGTIRRESKKPIS
ncbi:MAG: hypothetical protein DDT23_00034 [candidate division WS2 bacterium]|nr:hypothetical protein [Candidatus Lithacetigena glycinireducens]